ncbi:ABC transporter substrate-binding protein [Paenibacillus glycinis]|uniref:Extracellular solute-binding protein n=1 Tax=Paenibacillus glycinis TaxID=2697035 RepID=A0ABW9XME6_9BACL|nr:extracellular solute-binding protein [Paenibacillus glycinis]NBD23784.1 extracellular solute-binding protein [Paenibacillus glycinis]
MMGFGRFDVRANGIRFMLLPFFGLLLGACSTGTDSAGAGPERIVIGVPNNGYYTSTFGDYLSVAYPDLQVELVEMDPDYKKPLTLKQYEQKLEQEKPDLLLGYDIRYKQLAADGLLQDLAPRMADSGMKEDDFYAGMIDKMKRNGGGNLYAVAPTFQASVLYYNADLFRKYKVALPRDGMTIMDVMKLAGDFGKAGSNRDGIVGYHQPFSSMPHSLLFSLSTPEGLRPYNFQTGKVTMDTPAWRNIISTVIGLYKSGTFLMQDVKGETKDGEVWYGPDDVTEADLFKKGKSAMTIGGYNGMSASYNGMSDLPFETGMVTPPVSSVDSRSEYLGVYNYMAIPTGAEHGDTAWEMIRFMLSDYVAKVRSGLQEDLSTRKSYMNYDQNPLLPKLYDILPSVDQSYSMEGYDAKFTGLFDELEDREITAAVNGEKSADASIAAIQKEGQALMDAAKPKK